MSLSSGRPQAGSPPTTGAGESTGAPLLSFHQVSAAYGGVTVLHEVTLTMARGDVLAVLGRNGAGKTTLLNALFNLGPTVGGRIQLGDQDVTGWPTHRIARQGLALVPQGRGVFHTLAVHESLRLATLAKHRRGDWTLERVYETFPRLFERRRASSGALSGGERQMLALARALMSRPRLLLLDEPSLGLAPRIVMDILKIVGELRDGGVSILLVEQNARAALEIADFGYLMELGEVKLSGPASELANDPALMDSYLGAH